MEQLEKVSQPITDATFQSEVFEKGGMAVVKFWRDNCPACDNSAIPYEDVAHELSDVRFYSMSNKDGNKMGQEFKIKTTPTFIIFKDGREIDRVAKSITANYLKDKVNAAMPGVSPVDELTKLKAMVYDRAAAVEQFQREIQEINQKIAQLQWK